MNNITSTELEKLPSYIPTLKDLEEAFKILPPIFKVKQSYIKVPMQASSVESRNLGNGMSAEITGRVNSIVGTMTFIKINDSGNWRWVYEGIVKP